MRNGAVGCCFEVPGCKVLSDRIAGLARDRTSGASEILARAIGILRDALAARADVTETARAIVRAQPSMAPIWNAAIAALAAREAPDRFDAFARRVASAQSGLTRAATVLFHNTPAPRHIVTLSYSGTVLAVLHALHAESRLQVTCSEGRPAMEGRTMAARLASAGVAVTLTTDAALGEALSSASAVLVGADAVAAEWFLNKTGTRMLATAAAAEGVPVYVAATRDKFVASSLASRLSVRDAPAEEVWKDPHRGVAVRNFYFERTPHASISGIITENGVLDAAMVRQACQAPDREHSEALLLLLDEAPRCG